MNDINIENRVSDKNESCFVHVLYQKNADCIYIEGIDNEMNCKGSLLIDGGIQSAGLDCKIGEQDLKGSLASLYYMHCCEIAQKSHISLAIASHIHQDHFYNLPNLIEVNHPLLIIVPPFFHQQIEKTTYKSWISILKEHCINWDPKKHSVLPLNFGDIINVAEIPNKTVSDLLNEKFFGQTQFSIHELQDNEKFYLFYLAVLDPSIPEIGAFSPKTLTDNIPQWFKRLPFELEFLAPIDGFCGDFKTPNDSSIVMKLYFPAGSPGSGSIGNSALFPGDLEYNGWDQLMPKYSKKLQSHLLKVPHHGSRTAWVASDDPIPNTEDYKNAVLAIIDPYVAVISCRDIKAKSENDKLPPHQDTFDFLSQAMEKKNDYNEKIYHLQKVFKTFESPPVKDNSKGYEPVAVVFDLAKGGDITVLQKYFQIQNTKSNEAQKRTLAESDAGEFGRLDEKTSVS